MGVVVAIQARMSSSRLPGKVLMDLGGAPMLSRVWDACGSQFERIVMTSRDTSDDHLAAWMGGMLYSYRRGSLPDVLSRYVALARERNPSVLVRVCGDAPFIDKRWIWKAVEECERSDEPVFVPGALHCGSTEDWLRCLDETDEEDKEHAGAAWFEIYGRTLKLVPDGYRTINTKEDLEWARKEWRFRTGS
jgi:spore coat polysaccharide biosynthesis protein SpsF (cytidylyltransferase family)